MFYVKYGKRIFDLVLSFFVAVVGLPFFLLLMLLIKLEDGGRAIYAGERLGRDGKVFCMYKFRSMKVDAPDLRNPDGSTFSAANDPRVTKIGRFLRATSIDELPQVFNVLKGDMSLIGPRASTADAISRYRPEEIDKLRVRPGISGYSQAYGRNNLALPEKRRMDAWYANHVSLGLDAKIFMRTILTVIKGTGLYNNAMPTEREKELC